MTEPVSEDRVVALRSAAQELADLQAEARRVRIKALHDSDATVDPVADLDLAPSTQRALLVDQVRLCEIERARETPGPLAPALAALRARKGGRVAVLSGAGISVDAGFPTFRGADGEGLWEQVDPVELASVDGFQRNPLRTLRWYCWRRSLGLPAVATLAHATIAAAQAASPDDFAGVHTQNVDGLHEAAGNTGVNRIHGSIWCWREVGTFRLVFDPSDQLDDVPFAADGRPLVRPGVVMFGDYAPTRVYDRAIRQLRSADVAIVVGTSAQVSTLWPLLHAARAADALMVDVNPEPSPVTTDLGGVAIELPSGVGIPLALEALGAIQPATTDRLARTPRPPLHEVLPSLSADLLADDA